MIVGHEKTVERLGKQIESDNVAHAYLFVGQEALGKEKVALEFVKALQCTKKKKTKACSACGKCGSCVRNEKLPNPNIYIIEPETSSKGKPQDITINKVRELKRVFAVAPHSSPYKVAIIKKAERMNEEASNALLKILEEPSGQAVIILISNSLESIIPTILSRVQLIRFSKVPSKTIVKWLIGKKIKQETACKIALRCQGRPGTAQNIIDKISEFEDGDESFEQFIGFLDSDYNKRFSFIDKISGDYERLEKELNSWMIILRDMLFVCLDAPDAIINKSKITKLEPYAKKFPNWKIKELIQLVAETKHLILKTNINEKLALESLMLNL